MVSIREGFVSHPFVLKVVFAKLGMGNSIDLETIKKHLKRPKAPLIGLFSQFTFMPLVRFLHGNATFSQYWPHPSHNLVIG